VLNRKEVFMSSIGPEYIARMRNALTRFHDEVGGLIDRNQNQPVEGSIALQERCDFARSESPGSP
jgi:hypothetical protein